MIKSEDIYIKYNRIFDETLTAFNALIGIPLISSQLYDSMVIAVSNNLQSYKEKMEHFDEEIKQCSSTYYEMLQKKRETVESRIALLTSRFGIEFTPFKIEKHFII